MDTVTAGTVTAVRPPNLSASLTALGDAASAAALTHSDIRLHVLACQAHHEAHQLLGATPSTTTTSPAPSRAVVPDAARRVRAALARQQQPPPNAVDIAWLLQLADGFAR